MIGGEIEMGVELMLMKELCRQTEQQQKCREEHHNSIVIEEIQAKEVVMLQEQMCHEKHKMHKFEAQIIFHQRMQE